MSNLLQEIEAQISGAKTATAKQNVGTVREIGDGVAKIEGLTDTARSFLAITPASRKDRKSARRENFCRCRLEKACSDASSTPSASRLTAKAQLNRM
jgi:hypothetical protein